MSGPIGDMWLSLGAERSELCYPTSEVTTLPDGRRIQHFEHGAIIWTQQDGPLVEVSAR
jgi:LGFP repeat